MYTPEQIASINAARAANVAAGRDAYSGAGATIANPGTSGARPRFTPITSISSSDFGTRRQSLPTAPIPTAFNALRAVSDGVGNAPILEMNTQTAEDGQPSAYQRTKDRIYSLIGLQGTQGAETAKLQEEQGLEAKQNDLNRLTNLYTTTQKSWQDRIKAAQNNPGGTSEINNVQANTITRQANEDLANIAIQKSVAQGDLNTANEIIKSKIEAKFEPIKNEIQGLKEYIALNNDDLTDKEKLTIQDQINQKEEQRKSLTNAQIDAYRLALQNNAPKDVLAAIGASNTVEDTYAALGDYGVDAGQELDNAYKRAQISKLNAEFRGTSGGNSEDFNDNLNAYASDYNDTGKLPSPSQLKAAGLTIGQVTSYAKQVPKQGGALVSTNTGVKSSTLSALQQDGISALYDLTKKIDELSELFTQGNLRPTRRLERYNTLSGEFVDLLSRARSGAALTQEEQDTYLKKLPSGALGQFTLFPQTKFIGLKSSFIGILDSKLNTNQLSIYGYSKVKVGGELRTVGATLNLDGVEYRVLPDGTLTNIM